MTMELRSARPDDAPALADLYRVCFPAILRTASEWLEDVQSTPRRSWNDIIITIDSGVLAGALTLYPHELFIGGGSLKSGGIGGVAVLPEFRSRGISSQMMAEAFRRMNRSGQVLSMLYPFRHSFYARAGYGLIGELQRITTDVLSFPESVLAKHVLPFTERDLPNLDACYRSYALHSTCMIARTADTWRYDIGQWTRSEKQLYCFHENETVTGYILLTPHQHITVSEFVWTSLSALRGLLGFLRECVGNGRTVSICQPRDGFLQTLLLDPVIPEAVPLQELFPASGHFGYGYMARVIDCAAALRNRGYRPSTGDVTFEIDDPLFPENRMPITLHCHGNGFEVDHTASPNTLRMNIFVFSQVFCGYLPLEAAIRTGQAAATGDGEFVGSAFSVPAPNCLDFF
ncbi:MAG: GNAT family N-acetyltransferase [Ignavibacteriales bacterium]|nr:GNAT family N-acetyltransferase [Ignavibacteriales bacterium]